MYNVGLLRQVRDLIRDNPSRHEQQHYIGSLGGDMKANVIDLRQYANAPVPFVVENPDNPVCQTTACVAGWLVILGDPDSIEVVTVKDHWSSFSKTILRLDDSHIADYDDIGKRAAYLANLPLAVAEMLFDGSNSREDVLSALDHLIETPYESDVEALDAMEYIFGRECFHDWDEDYADYED